MVGLSSMLKRPALSKGKGSFSGPCPAPQIRVSLETDTLYLHPGPVDQPTNDPELRGRVYVTLARPTKLRKIKVELKAIQVVNGGGQDFPPETSEILFRTLTTDLHDEEFAEGEHSFAWSMIVSSSTAPYQRCIYGRTAHHVAASVQTSGWETSVATPASIFIVANGTPFGEAPAPLQGLVQDLRVDVGPISMTFTTPHLAVAGLVYLAFDLQSPPPNLRIVSVNAFIKQTVVVTYPDGRVVAPRSESLPLFRSDSRTGGAHSPPLALKRKGLFGGTGGRPRAVSVESSSSVDTVSSLSSSSSASSSWSDVAPLQPTDPAGNVPWSYKRIARLPDDNHLRPSTLEGTATSVRIRHKIIGEVRFANIEGVGHTTLRLAKEVTIASCTTRIESLELPLYSPNAPTMQIAPLSKRCLCHESYTDLVTDKYAPPPDDTPWEAMSTVSIKA